MSIVVNALSYIYPDQEIRFQHIHLSVATGDKAALVGHNGSGKSTLLQLIAGKRIPSEGEVSLSENLYYVPQHLGQYDAQTVAQVLAVNTKLQALHAILEGDASADTFAQLNDEWDIEERVQTALSYWHLDHVDLNQPMRRLSGGEKTKVFLAGILIHEPGIILLDEPSNHLDTQSRELLYTFIQRINATMLVVSHDRALLNRLDTTLELSKSGIEVFGGNYDFYRKQKVGKLNALQAQLDENTKSLRQAQQKARDLAEQRQKQESRGKAQGKTQSLPRIIAGGRKSQAELSTAKLNDVQNEKLTDLSDNRQQIRSQIQDYQILKIDLHPSDLHRGKILVEAQNINVSFGEEMLWSSPLSFQIRSGDRVRISGKNGSGKTTVIKLITGILQPSTGSLYQADFRFAYIDQEYSLINKKLTVYEQLQHYNSRHLPESELKMMLYRFQFPRETWDRNCNELSGGENMKLTLCCLVVSTNAPDLLILDEPTNNLDIQSQEVLTSAVKDFSGSIVVISHDQYFIDMIRIDSTMALS
ncbi:MULTISPECIES: ABC-F family ATP-binding cassette domain-containing protein [unclassified Spirosoma]|uniref:ABC-F family ATP-binding cassette domain-containing protein n=1 Tax=unclassified Spirosoma TaxID=2621999 RepID=UPI000960F673|nr:MULTISPECIES: ABC-F family ATP-binding cassette domain-containing protein [unclassified Spirosoma]MBN8823775.1 ABC-F family ATP-binding cassette domain-containing protein [Spirosoma sp.]OJW79824.1 MAG: ABC transporter ATP-binding protein [Spirosoma sp. 48-14]